MDPYRAAGQATRPTRMLLCARCAAVVKLDADRATFRCRGCALEQPVSRDGFDGKAEIRPVSHVPSVGRSHEALDAFAKGIGAPAGSLSLTASVDGLACEVSIELDSGRPTVARLAAKVPGFPRISLRRESTEEIDAKERGVTREVQIGDAAFDARTFIDSSAADDDLRMVLGAPAVRAAILFLLEETGRITFHDDQIVTYCPFTRIPESLAALRVIAGAPRPIAHEEQPLSGRELIADLCTRAAVPIGTALLILSSTSWPVRSNLVILAGMVGVAAGSLLCVWPLSVVYRGRSDSHRKLRAARMLTFVFTPLCIVALAVLANARLDGSPERVDELKVDGVSYDDEGPRTHLDASREGNDLGRVRITVRDPGKRVKVGQRVTVHTRAGALGERWQSQPACIDIGGRAFLCDD